jgi:tripartite motif-containing protein 71
VRRGGVGCALVVIAALTVVPTTAGAAITPLMSFGSAGSGAGQLNQATDVAVDSSGTAYVADKYNDRISEFNANGSFLRAFGWGVLDGTAAPQVCTSTCQAGILGAGAGQLNKPTAVAVDSTGMLYVGDKYNNRVSEFTSNGTFVRAFGWGVATGAAALEVCTNTCQIGSAGGGAGQINQTRGIAVGPDGTVYVAEEQGNRISEFTTGGAFIRAFGWNVAGGGVAGVCTSSCQAGTNNPGAGGMAFPRGVDADANTVYVANSGDNRIDEFTPAGTFIRGFGEDVISLTPPGTGPQVCTTGTGCQAGTPTGPSGSFTGAFNSTYGVVADGSTIYASDTQGQRINEFTTSGGFNQSFGWGVSDGSAAFQVCTAACRTGILGAGSGEFNSVDGLAVDCRGALYVSDRFNNRIQRFGEPGTPTAPCTAAQPPAPAAHKKKCKKRKKKHRSAEAAKKKCKRKKKGR